MCAQVEALLASEDYGKDLASVNNLLKKHQLLEADISAHEVGFTISRRRPSCRAAGPASPAVSSLCRTG